jgi:hypothetical protein
LFEIVTANRHENVNIGTKAIAKTNISDIVPLRRTRGPGRQESKPPNPRSSVGRVGHDIKKVSVQSMPTSMITMNMAPARTKQKAEMVRALDFSDSDR